MIAGLILRTLMIVAVISGEAVLTALGALPVIGGFASWYMGVIGPLVSGIGANLIYGVMAAQVVILPLSLVLYGPSAVRRGVTWLRKALAD